MSLIKALYFFLADAATAVEKSNFLKEIDMMKKVSSGESELSKFVVNMLGCMTYKEPMLLVLEFMRHGNLLDYLRLMRPKVRSCAKHAYNMWHMHLQYANRPLAYSGSHLILHSGSQHGHCNKMHGLHGAKIIYFFFT